MLQKWPHSEGRRDGRCREGGCGESCYYIEAAEVATAAPAELERPSSLLILGGVSYSALPIEPINRFYKRLAENRLDKKTDPTENRLDVELVDPEEWKYGDKGGVDRHYRMTLAEYAQEHPLDELLKKYDRVAIVDDMKFTDHRLREAIKASVEYQQLFAIADTNKDRVSW